MAGQSPVLRAYIGKIAEVSESYTLEKVCGDDASRAGIGTFSGVVGLIKRILKERPNTILIGRPYSIDSIPLSEEEISRFISATGYSNRQ